MNPGKKRNKVEDDKEAKSRNQEDEHRPLFWNILITLPHTAYRSLVFRHSILCLKIHHHLDIIEVPDEFIDGYRALLKAVEKILRIWLAGVELVTD